MKLYVLLDHLDYEKNSGIAHKLQNHADGYVVGSLPLLRYGVDIVDKLHKEFPQKPLYVETKIVDRARDIVSLASQSGADWVSVMGGARKEVIHTTASKAHDLGKKVFMDLLDTQLTGQDVLEAASLGVDALLLTQYLKREDYKDFLDRWQMIKGNTTLPIFFAGVTDVEIIPLLIEINPYALILGKVITDAMEPEKEIQIFKEAFV